MKGLDDVANQKLEALRKTNQMNTYDTIIWLRPNPHWFKEEIIEPAAVSAKVTDPKFAAAVESCLNRDSILVSPPFVEIPITCRRLTKGCYYRYSYPKTTTTTISSTDW